MIARLVGGCVAGCVVKCGYKKGVETGNYTIFIVTYPSYLSIDRWGQWYQGAGGYLCRIDTWFLLCTAPTCTAPVHNRNVKPILHRGLCELVLCIIGFAVRLRPSVCRHWTNFLLTQHISGDFLVLIWFLFNSMLWSIHRGARFSCAALGVKGKI